MINLHEALRFVQALSHAVGVRTSLDEAMEWAKDENNWKDLPHYTAEELISQLRSVPDEGVAAEGDNG